MAVLGPGSDRPAAVRPEAPAEDGESRLFWLPARNAAAWRQGKKAGVALAGRRSRLWPALGPDQPFEVHAGCAPRRTDGDHHRNRTDATHRNGWFDQTHADVSASTPGQALRRRTIATGIAASRARSKAWPALPCNVSTVSRAQAIPWSEPLPRPHRDGQDRGRHAPIPRLRRRPESGDRDPRHPSGGACTGRWTQLVSIEPAARRLARGRKFLEPIGGRSRGPDLDFIRQPSDRSLRSPGSAFRLRAPDRISASSTARAANRSRSAITRRRPPCRASSCQ